MSDSRERILKRLRADRLAASELPSLDQPWIQYDDPVAQFVEMVAAVGGTCVRVDDSLAAQRRVDELPVLQATPDAPQPDFPQPDAPQPGAACRLTPEFRLPASSTELDLQGVDDPHRLEHVDVLLFRSDLGVAENGALWVTDDGLRHRVIYFIAQHLVAVIAASRIVHNLHEGYQRLEFSGAGFGTWLAGPSKTADIEQSLVIGAHGARSLTVIVVNNE